MVYKCFWGLACYKMNLTLPNNRLAEGTYIFFISLVGWRRGCPVSWPSWCPPGSWGRDASCYRGHWKSSAGHSGPSGSENTSSRWRGRRNGTPTTPRKDRTWKDEKQAVRQRDWKRQSFHPTASIQWEETQLIPACVCLIEILSNLKYFDLHSRINCVNAGYDLVMKSR